MDRLALSKKWQAFVGARLDTLDYEDEPTGTEPGRHEAEPAPRPRLLAHERALAPRERRDRVRAAVHAGRRARASRRRAARPRWGPSSSSWAARPSWASSGYALEREDIAIPDSSGLFTQTGDQRSRGLEVDFSAEPAKGLVTYANYAFTDAELTRFAEIVNTPVGAVVFDRSGNTPAFVPRHLVNVWVSKELGNGLGAAVGLRALSEQFVGEDNRYTIPGYATLDAAVFYKIGPRPPRREPQEHHGHRLRDPGLRRRLRHPRAAVRVPGAGGACASGRGRTETDGVKASSGLEARAAQAGLALDAWVREVVAWHFSPETGTPVLAGVRAAALGFDPRKEIRSYADLARLGPFQDEWLRGGPVRRWVPKGYAGRPVSIFETGGSTGVPKSRINIEDFRIDYSMFSETLPDAVLPEGRGLAPGRALRPAPAAPGRRAPLPGPRRDLLHGGPRPALGHQARQGAARWPRWSGTSGT